MDSALKKQFRELRKTAGWSPAETARQLKCSRAHVSNIEKMDKATQPSERLLQDFREAIQRGIHPTRYPEQPERVVTPDAAPVAEAADQLREIYTKNPDALTPLLGVIKQVNSSTVYQGTKRVVKRVAARVKRGVPAPEPSQKADEQTSKK